MKAIILVLLLCLSLVSATTYYVSNDGNDVNAGTSEALAIKTITKLNTFTFQPNDIVKFQCGSKWNLHSDAYVAVNKGGVTYTNYGICGDLPIFESYINASDSANWTQVGTTYIWNSTFNVSNQVAWIFTNYGTAPLVNKSNMTWTPSDQGHFMWDNINGTVAINSTTNPATYYTSLYLTMDNNTFMAYNKKNNITIDGIEFRLGGRHGIYIYRSNGTQIRNCRFSYIGGAFQSGSLRYGDGIEFWSDHSNILVENNNISQIYDGATTDQSNVATTLFSNITWRNNLIRDSNECYELFNSGAGSITDGIWFYNNTCYNAGGAGFSEWYYRYDVLRRVIRFSTTVGQVRNVNFSNNIIVNGSNAMIRYETTFIDFQDDNVSWNRNAYWKEGGNDLIFYNKTVWWNLSNYSIYQGYGFDTQSFIANPYLTTNLQPVYNSLACGIGALSCDARQSIYNNVTVYLGRSFYSNTSDFDYSYSGRVMTVVPKQNSTSFKLSSTSPSFSNGIFLNGTSITNTMSRIYLPIGNIIYIGGT